MQTAATAAIAGRGNFDYLIVGAGFAGSVIAERLASVLGLRVLIVDKRPHIGGNAYDRYDDAGVLIHPYGPHIFHTNSSDIFDYLSQIHEVAAVPAPCAGQRRWPDCCRSRSTWTPSTSSTA